ncbi:discoidin domain-containing protein [Carnobacteriaceae bacterium zg-ZUI252]|nr:discoidin domain-containing protein [Carnobacteriaceae bacterium zg-ZUI252]
MKIKKGLSILSVVSLLVGVNGYRVMATETITQKVNVALNAQATVNDSETNYWGADKTVDGIINREESVKRNQSRWSTNIGTTNKILTVDLRQERTFQEFRIAWERQNIKGFRIEVSQNGTDYTSVYEKTDDSYVELDTTVRLNAEQTARYVRLVVTNYDGGTINWASVSVYEFQVISEMTLPNLALHKEATANGHEDTSLSANKATDGSIDTRWASTVGRNQKWLQVDLGEVRTVGSVVLEWERKNAQDYTILVSEDGQNWTEAKHNTTAPEAFRETINFDQKHQARYIKVQINQFNPSAPNRTSDKPINWATVSIMELEAYSESISPEKQITLQDVANGLQVPEITSDTTTWTLPEVPNGYTVSFIGADLEQVIDRDLTIHKPLVDTPVVVNYKVSKGADSIETAAIPVTVPGQYTVEETDNVKPTVVPAIAEWKGKTGEFSITDSTRIVVNPTDRQALQDVVNSFKESYTELTGKAIDVVEGTDVQPGDIYFYLNSENSGLKEEGYFMNIDDAIRVEASHVKGAFWSTQTLLQLLKQSTQIPKGFARDYPKYAVRGFVLDVGRKMISMEHLRNTLKLMAWYKMNDLHVHLNDNFINVERYQTTDNPYGAYSAFRLESDIKEGGNNGLNKQDLTSKDLFYTKAEFKAFIQEAKSKGIQVVPEFDTPAHALAFTKVRPDLTMTNHNVRRWVDHLEVSNPAALQFVKDVWNEYLDGDDATFADTGVIHVGVDEFEGNNESFRKFTDDLLAFSHEKHKTPRLWGSLTAKSGVTPVRSENVQMNIWNAGWANPSAMYKAGYQLINTLDGPLYIVPGAGYYNDFLNTRNLYQTWEPNKMGSVTIPAGSSQMLGGAFAIWNDKIDQEANGITEYDVYKRFQAALPTLATKLWGNRDMGDYNTFTQALEQIGEPANHNPYHEVTSKTDTIEKYTFNKQNLNDTSGNAYHGTNAENVEYADGKKGKALKLNGGTSYFNTPIQHIGPKNVVSFWVKLNPDAQGEQIVLESDKVAIKAVQKETGKMGISLEGYDHSFEYTLPKNEWVHIMIKGYENKTELYVNDVLTDTLGRGQTGNKFATLVVPAARVGSKTHALNGLLDDLVIAKATVEQDDPIDPTNFTVSTDNENNDGHIQSAFDNDLNTIWHTKWSPAKQELPATILIDMQKEIEIDKFGYVARQIGTNGYIKRFKLSVKTNESDEYTPVYEGRFSPDKAKQFASFAPSLARYVKLEVLEGEAGFGSAAEFSLYEHDMKKVLRDLVSEVNDSYVQEDYTDLSWQELMKRQQEAQAVLDDEQATKDQIDTALDALNNATHRLMLKDESPAEPSTTTPTPDSTSTETTTTTTTTQNTESSQTTTTHSDDEVTTGTTTQTPPSESPVTTPTTNQNETTSQSGEGTQPASTPTPDSTSTETTTTAPDSTSTETATTAPDSTSTETTTTTTTAQNTESSQTTTTRPDDEVTTNTTTQTPPSESSVTTPVTNQNETPSQSGQSTQSPSTTSSTTNPLPNAFDKGKENEHVLIDEKTGIQASNPQYDKEQHVLVVKEKAAIPALSSQPHSTYDIYVLNKKTQQIEQIAGETKVFVPTRQRVQKVHYIKDDQVKEDVSFENVSGGIVFRTTHFSIYALVYNHADLPDTGTSNDFVWQVVGLMLCLSAGYLLRKKSKI